MSNMKEKNYKSYGEIEGLDLILEEMKESEGKIIKKAATNECEIRGLFINIDLKTRYFCSCGFIGDTVNQTGLPVCKNCENTLWLKIEHWYDHLIKIFEIRKDKDYWFLDFHQYSFEMLNNDMTVKIKKEFISSTPLNKEILKGDVFPRTLLIDHFSLEDFEKLFKPLPVYDKWLMFNKKDNSKFYSVKALNKNIAIINNLFFSDTKHIEENLLQTQYNAEIIELVAENILSTDEWLKENNMFEIYNNIFTNYTIDDLVKALGFEELKDPILISLINKNIALYKNAVLLNDYRKNLPSNAKDIFNILVLDGMFKSHYLDVEIASFNKVSDYSIFEKFYINYRYIYGFGSVNAFLYRVEYCKDNNLPLDIIPTKHFSSIQNLKSLEDQKIPKTKIEIFNHLIDEDPLKAYSFLANRRKLTKKETEEYKKIIEA